MKRNLVDSFMAAELTEHEKIRIAHLVAKNEFPVQIIRRYATGTRTYRTVYQKKEKIPGYRPGTPAFDKAAVERLIIYLTRPKQANSSVFWSIYKEAFFTYASKERPGIADLLSEVTTDSPLTDASQILTVVCSNAKALSVTKEQVRELYAASWIPRAENFEALLPLCEDLDEARAQSVKTRSLEGLIEATKAAQVALEARINKFEPTLRIQDARYGLIEDEVRALSASIEKIEQWKKALLIRIEHQERLTPNVEQTHLEFNRRIKGVETGLSKKLDITAFQANEKRLVASSKKSLSEALNHLQEAITYKIEQKLVPIEESFEARIASLVMGAHPDEERNPSVEIIRKQTYESPLLRPAANKKVQAKINNELDFANSWMTLLTKDYGVYLTFEQTLALATILTSSPVVIAASSALAHSWIECLAWEHYTLEIAASPLWSSEADWHAGLNHLFKDQPRTPRILIIHDFDVALIECYLTPTLVLWNQITSEKILTKIILIPSGAKQKIDFQVLDHAPKLSLDDFSNSVDPQTTDVRIPPVIRGSVPTGVEPEAFRKWSTSFKNIEYDFHALQSSLELELSPTVLTSFKRIIQRASVHFDEPSATGLGMKHLLLPWVLARHGEATFSALGEFLRQFTEVRY